MTSHNSNSTDHKTNHNANTSQSNWYAKLHPIGTAQQTADPKKLLNLSIFFRIWLAVVLVLIICGIVVFTQLFSYVKPTVQQVIEDTLLDTSKLLAASLQQPLQSKELYDADYQNQLDTAFIDTLANNNVTRPDIQYDEKTYSSFRIYVTDKQGMVIYDSFRAPNNAEGQDYSRWNDVYLTLKGQYGARSTTRDHNQRDGTVMYVAQPIKDDTGNVIGIVSVGKPVASVLPYLDNTRKRMLITALLISIVALILAGLVAWWLKQSISLVTQYTRVLAEDTKKPYFYLGHELNSLTDTIETMKHRLENRGYVNDYVHTLTHELKSPLTAIRASSELLEDDGLDEDDRQMLIQTVGEQSIKMQQLIDRLLLLAKVEQPTFRLNRQASPLLPILQSLVNQSSAKLQQQNLMPINIYLNNKPFTATTSISPDLLSKTTVYADSFWLVQALQNILDNAISFAANSVSIHIYTDIHADIHTTAPNSVTIDIFNDGKLLPDYAVAKVFDRYFSLSHQSIAKQNQSDQISAQELSHASSTTLKKGTGLGLTLVKQVIEHHGGQVAISNINPSSEEGVAVVKQRSGVMVSITLPLAKEQNA